MATASIEIIADSSQVRTATRDLQQLARQGSSVQKSTKGIETSIAGVGASARASSVHIESAGRSVGSFGTIAQNAGYQVQDFAVQVAGGQSAFMAFAQQAPQFLGAFGAGGAVAGAFISIAAIAGGVFASSMMDGKTAAERLSESMEALSATVSISEDGILELSAAIRRLASESPEAAVNSLEAGIVNAEKAARQAAIALGEAFSADYGFSELNDYIKESKFGIDLMTKSSDAFSEIALEIGEQLGLSGVKAQEAGVQIADMLAVFRATPSLENLNKLQSIVAGYGEAARKSGSDAVVFVERLQAFVSTARDAVLSADELRAKQKELADGGFAEVDLKSAALTERLKAQLMVFQEGELKASLYSAALATGKKSIEELDPAIASLVTQLYEAEQAKLRAASATREQTESSRELEQQMRLEAQAVRQQIQEQQKATAEAQRIRDRATNSFESLQSGLDAQNNPAEQARQQLQARLDVIREYAAQEGADKAAAMDAQLRAEEAYQQELTSITAQEAQQRRALTQDQLSAASNFLGTFAELAREGGEKSFQSYKRLAQAQAAIAGAQAIIRALAEGGPFFGPALAAGIGALTAVQIAKINQQQYVGRATGGQVIGDRSYLVGERGPELFTPNSSGNGRITPFSQLMQQTQSSGNNAPIINITNVGGGEATVTNQRFSETDRRWVIDVVAGDMQRRGKVHKSITSTTDATNRTI